MPLFSPRKQQPTAAIDRDSADYTGWLHKEGGKECYVSDGSCTDDSGKVRTRD